MVNDDNQPAWETARLIPTSGIKGSEEQERRATSGLLAVMRAVDEFGHAITSDMGAPKGRIETFIEVPFELGDKNVRPDGLIQVTRGAKCWTALVEVKTGRNELESSQVEAYLDVAKEHEFDAVLTISNEVAPIAGVHPTKVDKRKLRSVALYHWSWARVLSEAIMHKVHRGVSDPDQAWILGELIRYLEHPKSGALEFDDMGSFWVPVREAVAASTLRASDKGVSDVVTRFNALIRFVSLQLGRRLGTDVSVVLSRKEAADHALRCQSLVACLTKEGTLTGTLKIPNTIAPLRVTADLRARQITCDVTVMAPSPARAKTRVTWLTRQLKAAPDTVRIEACMARQRGNGATELLGKVREKPELLIEDPTREITSFTIARAVPMGVKRGVGRGAFITTVIEAVDDFYSDVLQNLRAWTPPTPKLAKDPEPARADSGEPPLHPADSADSGGMPLPAAVAADSVS